MGSEPGTERDEAAEPTGEGRSSRDPGSTGEAPPESIDTDTEAGAERTQPGSPPESSEDDGDAEAETAGSAHGVSVPATESLEGSSEDSNVVKGVRSPVPASPAEKSTSAGGQYVSQVRRPGGPDGEVGPT